MFVVINERTDIYTDCNCVTIRKNLANTSQTSFGWNSIETCKLHFLAYFAHLWLILSQPFFFVGLGVFCVVGVEEWQVTRLMLGVPYALDGDSQKWETWKAGWVYVISGWLSQFYFQPPRRRKDWRFLPPKCMSHPFVFFHFEMQMFSWKTQHRT